MCKAIFCDWTTVDDNHNKTTLFTLKQLSEYQLLFFDPLHFSLKYQLRQNSKNIYDKEYVAYSEENIGKYINQVKIATDYISSFIKNGGLFVIRTNFPNTEIVVRKEKSTGRGDYAKSVISPFFWLENFIGNFSFNPNTLSQQVFTDKNNPLYDEFKNCNIHAPLTLDKITVGRAETIAHNGKGIGSPTITQVRYPKSDGKLFLVPQFIIDNECDKLVDAFTNYAINKTREKIKPVWISTYEKELEVVDPYDVPIFEIDLQIKKLENEKSELQKKRENLSEFINLLLADDDELVAMVYKVFCYLGFYKIDPPTALKRGAFDLYLKDRNSPYIVGQIFSTKEEYLTIENLHNFTERIENCKLSDKPKGIIIANTAYLDDPKRRPMPFPANLILENKETNYCLISMPELFELTRYLVDKDNSTIKEKITESLRKDILECDSFYEVNKKKYYTKV